MTNGNGNGNRDDELELIRQLLIATASRTESTDARLDRLVESQDRTQGQLDQLSVKVDQLSDNVDRLSNNVDQLSNNVDQLREDVDIAFQTIQLLSENTDREMRQHREETQRIWNYLMRRDGNGDHPPQ